MDREGSELKARRELLVRLLNNQFPGAVPAGVTTLINEQESLDLLDHWFDAAVDAATVEEFMAVVKQ